jgi:hypothetical protein
MEQTSEICRRGRQRLNAACFERDTDGVNGRSAALVIRGV